MYCLQFAYCKVVFSEIFLSLVNVLEFFFKQGVLANTDYANINHSKWLITTSTVYTFSFRLEIVLTADCFLLMFHFLWALSVKDFKSILCSKQMFFKSTFTPFSSPILIEMQFKAQFPAFPRCNTSHKQRHRLSFVCLFVFLTRINVGYRSDQGLCLPVDAIKSERFAAYL